MKQFQLRLDDPLAAWVEAQVEAAHTNRTEWIRQALWRIHDNEKKTWAIPQADIARLQADLDNL
jgi:Arc/MetJ-type ribon-helix-helix transcriptional regulator